MKLLLAEKEGFEPPDLLQSTVFKTAAFDRSAISPVCRDHFVIASANIVRFFDCESFFETIYKENNIIKKENPQQLLRVLISAEKEGFEPPDLLQSTVFKTAAFDRSAISPVCRDHFVIASANIVRFFDCENFFCAFFKLFFKCLIISIS